MDKVGKKVRKRVKEKPFLPDEIITNILMRLPVKSVVRFEIVCRKWRDIILARDFVDLHHRNSIPLILVAPTNCRYEFEFAIDKWWDLARTRCMIHRFPFCAADFPYALIRNFSHAGLIVLDGSFIPKRKISILNPARPSDQCVEINLSKEFWSGGSDICAVYYQPLLEEYCSLWKIYKSGHPKPIQYQVLNLGSKPSFKRIRNPFSCRVKDEYAYPVSINNNLYWMLKSEQEDRFGGRNDILEFDIISEEFKVIPCPIPLNTECKEHQTNLLNSDGVISFVLILPSTITIWRLEDHVQQLWTSTEYTTSLKSYLDVYAFHIIAVVDEKLAFESGGRLFVCNLMEGTVKNFPKKRWYSGNVLFLNHQMTLASLKDCKSPLYIDKDGKVFRMKQSRV